MCKMRRVRNVYKCGHAINEIKCESTRCKFSPMHPPDCRPPQCTQTCWQYHQYPEQYCKSLSQDFEGLLRHGIAPHIGTVCAQCAAAGYR
ncbi:hypothetical protein BC629DRAFT_1514431 [Irpex lacteus]|nr:hypothetical protein BC629DRAFT_1514431 [Irpex lacteus]